MFFFCKPKTIVLDVFTYDHAAILVPPGSAVQHKPKWWHQLNPTVDSVTERGLHFKQGNIRRCKGFKDYYSDRNLIIPMWKSFIFECDKSGYRYIFSDNSKDAIEFQPENLRGDKYLKNYYHFKMQSPWRFCEKQGIYFTFAQAFYNFEDPANLIIPPATVEYKHQNTTNIHFFAKPQANEESYRIEVEAGQPMVHLTPMTEKRVVVKPHLVSYEEYARITPPIMFFTNVYAKLRRLTADV